MDEQWDENEMPSCPACYSDDASLISDEEKNYALGLWDIYDFIGRLHILTMKYQCHRCGYQW